MHSEINSWSEKFATPTLIYLDRHHKYQEQDHIELISRPRDCGILDTLATVVETQPVGNILKMFSIYDI